VTNRIEFIDEKTWSDLAGRSGLGSENLAGIAERSASPASACYRGYLMGTYITKTTEQKDSRFEVEVVAPGGAVVFHDLADDADAATRVASDWKLRNLASACMNGNRSVVEAALSSRGLLGGFEVLERPDACCQITGPTKAVDALMEEQEAFLCPPLGA
jgi:hypothetical protein